MKSPPLVEPAAEQVEQQQEDVEDVDAGTVANLPGRP
jgi:hypothetical protein